MEYIDIKIDVYTREIPMFTQVTIEVKGFANL